MRPRSSGVLLHITSLPSRFGHGDLGPEAYRFADWLHAARQRIWQLLPLTPVSSLSDFSPYSSSSAFAGNPLLVSPERLIEQGLLAPADMPGHEPATGSDQAELQASPPFKEALLDAAWRNFRLSGHTADFERFCREQAHWLEDFALFEALSGTFGTADWSCWPTEYRDREAAALDRTRQELAERIDRIKFGQYLFFEQWLTLKRYCNARRIQLFGDMPIYVSFESCDVWSNRELFKLDPDGRPSGKAGVPPDYFSDTGQLWGNPLYDWERMGQDGYAWWQMRLQHTLELFDLVRIDHFRGLISYWEVPPSEETAVNGFWVDAPFGSFFRTLNQRFPCLPLVAEDLGEITPDVREALLHTELPGMKVLLFAFGEDDPWHIFLPHSYPENCVAYTGTHDTNTARGWFEEETSEDDRARLFRYLGREVATDRVAWELIRLGMGSVAKMMISPMQDLLGLPSHARMNRPGEAEGNWRWRLRQEQLDGDLSGQLAELTRTYGRV